jgi:hypothetical protein
MNDEYKEIIRAMAEVIANPQATEDERRMANSTLAQALEDATGITREMLARAMQPPQPASPPDKG